MNSINWLKSREREKLKKLLEDEKERKLSFKIELQKEKQEEQKIRSKQVVDKWITQKDAEAKEKRLIKLRKEAESRIEEDPEPTLKRDLKVQVRSTNIPKCVIWEAMQHPSISSCSLCISLSSLIIHAHSHSTRVIHSVNILESTILSSINYCVLKFIIHFVSKVKSSRKVIS